MKEKLYKEYMEKFRQVFGPGSLPMVDNFSRKRRIIDDYSEAELSLLIRAVNFLRKK